MSLTNNFFDTSHILLTDKYSELKILVSIQVFYTNNLRG